MEHSIFKDFTNLYSLLKTLRFELIPQGSTLESIKKNGLIQQDEKRSLDYQSMKKAIDEYHKYHIEQSLKGIKLDNLEKFQAEYFTVIKTDDLQSKDTKKKNIEALQKDIRKQIVDLLIKEPKAKERFTNLFKRELITQLLEPYIKDYNERIEKQDKKLKFIPDFKKFTTYFSGFHENRKNMYSADDKSTAIAYRIIHENLPKFLDNQKNLLSIKTNHTELFNDINKELNHLVEGVDIDKIYDIDYFNETCTQQGISFYNELIGGRVEDKKPKIQGINEYINLYNQKNKLKGNKKVAKLKPLYKQILSDRASTSFLPDKFENDNELKNAITNFWLSNIDGALIDGKTISVINELQELCENIASYDLSKIYIRADSRKFISNKIFGNYAITEMALGNYYDKEINKSFQKNIEKLANNAEKQDALIRKKQNDLNQPYSIQFIQQVIDDYVDGLDKGNEHYEKIKNNRIKDYFSQYCLTDIKDNDGRIKKQMAFDKNIINKYTCIKGILEDINEDIGKQNKLLNDTETIKNIKYFLDALMEFFHFLKPLNVSLDETDQNFYGQFLPLYDELSLTIPLYNQVRNYLTKKPYSVEKFKLNFENPTLLNGWDKNKERDNSGVLLRRGDKYYLAIMPKGSNKTFTDIPKGFKADKNGEYFEKVDYKLLPGANKMLPKVFLSKKGIENYYPSDEILEGYKSGKHTKGGKFDIQFMHKLIDYFKKSISLHPDWQHFNHQFSDTNTYEDISQFYKEVEHQGYKLSFRNISKAYIDEQVSLGNLYLFQIYNKDFSENKKSKGSDNLHTVYWKALFDEKNLKNIQYKLNGEAEIFFREKSLEHPHEKMEKGHHYEDLKDKFNYPIISNRRFTEDKFLFHVPITMNFKAQGTSFINHKVLNTLQHSANTNIIGIDRGERNLLYVSVINAHGEIIEQKNFNEIAYQVKGEANKRIISYHDLLSQKQIQRDKARVNWHAIENIKELKKGYLSIVVHEIVEMMIKHNAFIVLEDLNFGFKRGRFKIEKQVYQNLEKALIDKLNFLVLKNNEDDKLAGRFNALQLTSQFDSFKNLGKQTGFLFYTPAWNTSKIDPVTGFVDLLKPRYENAEKANEFFNKFEYIRYNSEADYFEFSIDYNLFHNRAQDTKTQWIISTYGNKRYVYNRKLNNNKGGSEEIDVTEKLKLIFNEVGIDYQNNKDLKQAILEKHNVDLYKLIMFCLKVVLALRYSYTEKDKDGNILKEEDYILSPIKTSFGDFFDSRKMLSLYEKTGQAPLPIDADANGAYHISKKGAWNFQKIRDFDVQDEKGELEWKKLKLAISNKEWLQFVQQDVSKLQKIYHQAIQKLQSL